MKEFITNLLGKSQGIYLTINKVVKTKYTLSEKYLKSVYNKADKSNQIPKLRLQIGKYLIESKIKEVK